MTSQQFDLRTALGAVKDLTSEQQALVDDSFSEFQVFPKAPIFPFDKSSSSSSSKASCVIYLTELSGSQWGEAVTYLTEVGQAFSKLEKEGKRLLGLLAAGTADPLWPTLTFGCV